LFTLGCDDEGQIVAKVVSALSFVSSVFRAPDGYVHIVVEGLADSVYTIEGSTDLGVWIDLATAALPATKIWEHVDLESSGLEDRFYRITYQP
jgi:hypothetical protein